MVQGTWVVQQQCVEGYNCSASTSPGSSQKSKGLTYLTGRVSIPTVQRAFREILLLLDTSSASYAANLAARQTLPVQPLTHILNRKASSLYKSRQWCSACPGHKPKALTPLTGQSQTADLHRAFARPQLDWKKWRLTKIRSKLKQ